MTDELTPTATDWAAMRFEERQDAVCEKWHGFQRRTLGDAWDIGRGLRTVKDLMQHGEWLPWLDSIGMARETARRFMVLAEELQITQLGEFASVDDALKALPPKRPKPEPTTVDVKPERAAPGPEPPTNAEEEAAVEEVAAEAEAERDPEAERDARDERLARRLEDAPGEAVDVLSDQLDRADVRHREDVDAVNEARKAASDYRRKCTDVCNALLAIPRKGDGQRQIDDVLAKFYGVARK